MYVRELQIVSKDNWLDILLTIVTVLMSLIVLGYKNQGICNAFFFIYRFKQFTNFFMLYDATIILWEPLSFFSLCQLQQLEEK